MSRYSHAELLAASLYGGRFSFGLLPYRLSSSGSLAIFAAILRASFRRTSVASRNKQKGTGLLKPVPAHCLYNTYPLVTTGAAGGGAFPLP
jgi:hypothetical protein